ncbi:hypothetical protein H0W80_05225 [Candidatus Saccharibacteria bacterium]|nr:hypothetical protein [Candidatus Saccharibacteria bacterium]
MSKQNLLKRIAVRSRIVIAAVFTISTVIMPFALSSTAQAAQITSRKVTLGSSTPSAATSYTLSTAALPTATAVQSLELVACTTASGACTLPSGFTSVGSATTGTTTGLGTNSGWTNNTATAGKLRITNTNAVAPSGVVSVPWTAVTNPSATNTTYYLRMNTYSDVAWSTLIDSGVIAVSTSTAIVVTASVDESLTFCTGTSGITSTSCSGATGSSVALGTLTPSTSGTGTSQVGVTTNASSGYVITYNGVLPTSGANTIASIGAGATSPAQGTSQFGMNLVANTVPTTFGATVAGAGSAVPVAAVNTTNQYSYTAGAATNVVSQGTADGFRFFTVSYLANVSGTQAPGTYTTTLTYVCTATF